MSYCHRLTFKKKSYEVFLKRQRPQRKRKSYFFFLCILLCSCYVKKKWTKRTNKWIFFLEKGGKEAFQIILFIFWRKTRFSVGTTRHKKFIRGVWYATRKASFQVCWMLHQHFISCSYAAWQPYPFSEQSCTSYTPRREMGGSSTSSSWFGCSPLCLCSASVDGISYAVPLKINWSLHRPISAYACTNLEGEF